MLRTDSMSSDCSGSSTPRRIPSESNEKESAPLKKSSSFKRKTNESFRLLVLGDLDVGKSGDLISINILVTASP